MCERVCAFVHMYRETAKDNKKLEKIMVIKRSIRNVNIKSKRILS